MPEQIRFDNDPDNQTETSREDSSGSETSKSKSQLNGIVNI